MKRLSTSLVLLLTGTLIASTGCARWTLLPRSSNSPAAQDALGNTAHPNNPQAQVGNRPAAAQASNAYASAQSNMSQDLRTIDPALAIARLTERQGDPNDARRQYLRFMEKHPENPAPHHRLGVMAARDSKFDEAEAHFQTAARLAPPSAELMSDMGYLLYLQSRLPEAEQLMQQASRMEPANQTYVNNLALVLAAKGDFDGSMRHFRKVNEEGEARANLAYTLSQQGELDHARKEYLHALTLDNKLNNAAKALLQVEEARKREQVAVARRQEALGDELLQGQPAGTSQPVQSRPTERMPPLELSGQQQPVSPVAAAPQVASRPGAQQPTSVQPTSVQPAAYQPRQVAAAETLMPIPAAASTAASQPHSREVQTSRWHETYEVADVADGVTPSPSQENYEVTELPAPQSSQTSSVSPTQPIGSVRPASHEEPVRTAAKPSPQGWQSAWKQLSQPSPQPSATEKKSGYSISFGDQ